MKMANGETSAHNGGGNPVGRKEERNFIKEAKYGLDL